jgi:DNA-binding NarL/FixJ family response regulator
MPFPTDAMAHLRTYIVEDSPVIRENLIATLEEMVPVEVIGTAEDESSATQWLGKSDNACDLVIIDIFLKSGSGLGLLQTARQAQSQRKLVVLSNYATPDMRRKCLQLGADKVFDKSNEIDGLISYCARLASGEETNSGLGALPS